MLQHNEAVIRCAAAAATYAEAIYIGAKEVIDVLASVQETKKAVDDAKEYLLKATAEANACVLAVAQEVNAFALKTTSDAFNSPAIISTAAIALMCACAAAKTATADAAHAACEYAEAFDADEAAKENLAVALAHIQDIAKKATATTLAATTVVSRATGPT